MEKEMKKLLLVAVSAGVFLMITITVAIVLLTPKVHTQDSLISSGYSMGRIPPAVEQPAINNVPDITITNENVVSDVVAIADRNNGDSLTTQRPVTEAVPETNAATPSVATRAAPVQTTQTTRTAPTAQRTTTTPRPAATRTINDFWIQTGAYPSMVGAEYIRELLASNGLVGIVSVFDNSNRDGRTWYRVRLGPYTNEREANHWLEFIQTIGFHDSQIRQTIRQQ